MVDRDEQVGFHFQIDDNSMAATHGLYSSGSSHSSTVRDLFLSSKPQVHYMNDSYNSPRAITECGYGWVQRRWQGGIRLVPGGNSQETKLKFSALVGMVTVDGMRGHHINPCWQPILTSRSRYRLLMLSKSSWSHSFLRRPFQLLLERRNDAATGLPA